VLSKPFLEVTDLSTAVVFNWVALVALGVELESGVSSDLNTINFVGSSVELTNDNAWDILEFSSELFPNWGKLLAVTAPWGVELNENIIVRVNNNLLESLADKNL
jgi:hypothetical protein